MMMLNYVSLIVALVYCIAVAATVVAVLMDRRQPAKAMAWIMVLIFVPVAGIVLYIFFGQNTRKERYISQLSMDQLTRRTMNNFEEQGALHVPGDHRSLVRLFASQNRALPFKADSVDILCTGYDFCQTLLREISAAQHHIHLESYIMADDPMGRLIADALIARARQGVEVRLIYDDVGCWRVSSRFFERLRSGGVDVHAFMPVRFPAFTSKVNYRNHRKLFVADGRVALIGGMNIALRYVKGRHGEGWRDTHLRLTGSAVYGVQQAFLVDWYFVDRTLLSDRRYYPTVEPSREDDAQRLVQVVTSSPVSRWPEMEQGYVRLLLEAKEYVYMQSPYFLPTEAVLFAMRTAALAGVDVRLMVPLRTDARFVEWASHSYVQEIAEAGVKVFFYTRCFNHSKLLVSDDTLTSCGSTNIDFRSFENNFEANAFIYGREMALRMKQVFLDDLRHCIAYDDYTARQHPSFFVRLRDSLVRLFAPLM